MATEWIPRKDASPTFIEKQLMKIPYARTVMAVSAAGYLGYEYLKDNIPNPFSDAPTGNDQPLPTSKVGVNRTPLNPPVTTPIEKMQKSLNDTVTKVNENFETVQKEIEEISKANKDAIKAMGTEQVAKSPFLSHQLSGVDALNSIADGLKAQTLAIHKLTETLDYTMTAMVTLTSINAQNLKVIADAHTTAVDDSGVPYVDTNSFYDGLIESNMDGASATRINTLRGLELQMLSDSRASGESVDVLRKRITAFRADNLPNSISSLYSKTLGGLGSVKASSPAVNVAPAVPVVNVAPVAPVVNVAPASPAVNVSVPETPVSVNIEAPSVPDYSSYLERIAKSADSAKVVSDYIAIPRDLTDINGNGTVRVAPMELVAMKDFALAKGEADTNSLAPADLDIVDSLFDDMDISSDMLKNYVRFDAILNKASEFAENGVDDWTSLMEEFYR